MGNCIKGRFLRKSDFGDGDGLFTLADRAGALWDIRAWQGRAERIRAVKDDHVGPLIGPQALTGRAAKPLCIGGPLFVSESHNVKLR